jgi:hypothetical protein
VEDMNGNKFIEKELDENGEEITVIDLSVPIVDTANVLAKPLTVPLVLATKGAVVATTALGKGARSLKDHVSIDRSVNADTRKSMKENHFRFAFFDERAEEFTNRWVGLMNASFLDKNKNDSHLFDLTIKSKDNLDLIYVGRLSKVIEMTPEALKYPKSFNVGAHIAKSKNIKEPVITPPEFNDVKSKRQRQDMQLLYFEKTREALIEVGYNPEDISINKHFKDVLDSEIHQSSVYDFVKKDLQDMQERKEQFKEDVKNNIYPPVYDVSPVLDPADKLKKPHHKMKYPAGLKIP